VPKDDRLLMAWHPVASNPDRRVYRVIGDPSQYPWRVVPSRTPSSPAIYYVNGDRVYRDSGHPDGPSSVPYMRLTRRWVFPGEGYAAASTDRPVYEVAYPKRRRHATVVRKLRD
jgi:hypothetical protein